MAEYPDVTEALDQLAYARDWYATYNTVGACRRFRMMHRPTVGRQGDAEAPKEAAQRQADALMKPYVEQTALKLPD